MVRKPTKISTAVDAKDLSFRTPDSVVWNNTKARDLVPSVRFSWDRYQKVFFVKFLETVGLSFMNSDFTPLLVQLNLNGYENIQNDYGENVHHMIQKKVRRKLKNTADELGEEVLMQASFGLKTIDPGLTKEPVTGPSNKHILQPETATDEDIEGFVDNSNVYTGPSSERSSIRSDTTTSGARPSRPSPSVVKTPEQKSSTSPSTPKRDNKHKIQTSSNLFTLLDAPTPKLDVKVEQAPPLFNFLGSRKRTPFPPSPKGANDVDGGDLAKRNRAERSIERLVSYLKRADAQLNEIESAFDDLPPIEEGREVAEMIRNLRTAFYEVEVGAEEIKDFATSKLKV
ncbi:hypothetical protein F4804DRAFT_351190 [Jackrogersella minutella]|nr:hypothetical protein F4804DRAFT_351190 [Jackrogersella minutella]